MKAIEFVCSGNNCRSILAEAIATDHLFNMGYNGEYQAVSSGTLADATNAWLVNAGQHPGSDWVNKLVKLGLERNDVYGLSQSRSLSRIVTLDSLNPDQIAELQEGAHKAVVQFCREEIEHRDAVARSLGIKTDLKTSREQITRREDVVAVLGMGPMHTDLISGLYGEDELIIDTLRGFAYSEPGSEFPHAYGKGFDEHLEMGKRIKEYTIRSIDSIVKLEF